MGVGTMSRVEGRGSRVEGTFFPIFFFNHQRKIKPNLTKVIKEKNFKLRIA